jgi:hypothetical protein
MTLDWQTRYRKNDLFVFREIAGEMVLVPIRRNAADLDNLYVLNNVGARIWELLDGERTLQAISDILCEEYEVSLPAAQQDLAEFVEQLASFGGIERE